MSSIQKRKYEPPKPKLRHLPSCLIALGVPARLVARNQHKGFPVSHKKAKPYAGTNYNNSIYNRFEKDELLGMATEYFRKNIKLCHPDHGGNPKHAEELIYAYERAKRLIGYNYMEFT